MRGLSAALTNLARLKRQWAELTRASSFTEAAQAPGGVGSAKAGRSTRLRPVTGFGHNPGELAMFIHVPARLARHPRPALVVVLHGCTQSAADYDDGSGWSTLADRHGFILVYPQQRTANNPHGCFNWFVPQDATRDHGEALSIRQMVEHAIRAHDVDRGRVFVTGLSAGGAMTAVMLATYPDVFAAGAVVAGLPYGVARNVEGALEAMFKGGARPGRALGDLVRGASPHRGPWPRLSVWHGDADPVVSASNARELVNQWLDLHGLAGIAPAFDQLDGQSRAVWRDRHAREVIETVTIAGLGHGTPLATGAGAQHAGRAGPYMLEAGISSSHHIARFWGLIAEPGAARAGVQDVAFVSPDGTIRLGG